MGKHDWSDMIGVLKEELRESHSDGAQEGMIRASLRGLKGSATEQANVRSLLLLFGLVPEDTHCPLEVLLLMFNAINPASKATLMHVRKWLRILIGRSLLLGTIDRPSVHDLVLDFAVAQQGSNVRENHRRIVEAFRQARPADVHGRRQFVQSVVDDVLSTYVCNEIGFHLRIGWEAEMERDSLAMTGWLGDVPQDELVVSAGEVLGIDRLSAAAERAEAERNLWLAGRYWSVASIVVHRSRGTTEAKVPLERAMDAIVSYRKHCNGGNVPAIETDAVDEVELQRLCAFGTLLDIPGIRAREADIRRSLVTQAAIRDPLRAGLLPLFAEITPALMEANLTVMGQGFYNMSAFFRKTIADTTVVLDSHVRMVCQMMAYQSEHCIEAMLLQIKDFNWEEEVSFAHDRTH